jgi:hypothetical protein
MLFIFQKNTAISVICKIWCEQNGYAFNLKADSDSTQNISYLTWEILLFCFLYLYFVVAELYNKNVVQVELLVFVGRYDLFDQT